MTRNPPATSPAATKRRPKRKTSALERGLRRRSTRVRPARRRRCSNRSLCLDFRVEFQWDSFAKNHAGVFAEAGLGAPGGFCSGVAEGEAAGCPLDGEGEAVGVAPGPGWVPGIAPGGLEAAAGWPRFSELIPWTDVGFGVPLA